MWRLIKHLEENREAIINYIGSIPISKQDIICDMTVKLCEIRPKSSNKECQELAIAIMTAMWLGYRAQDKEAAAFFRDAIFEAFETGRRFKMLQ